MDTLTHVEGGKEYNIFTQTNFQPNEEYTFSFASEAPFGVTTFWLDKAVVDNDGTVRKVKIPVHSDAPNCFLHAEFIRRRNVRNLTVRGLQNSISATCLVYFHTIGGEVTNRLAALRMPPILVRQICGLEGNGLINNPALTPYELSLDMTRAYAGQSITAKRVLVDSIPTVSFELTVKDNPNYPDLGSSWLTTFHNHLDRYTVFIHTPEEGEKILQEYQDTLREHGFIEDLIEE